jgi:ubiquinone/menaquinone biosynthesis C-methylase UbiE
VNSDCGLAGYDDIPEQYDQISGPHFFEPVAEHLIALLPLSAGHRLLDVACGTGLVAASAMRHGTVRVVGVDLSVPMMRCAAKRGVRHLVAGELTELPFADSSFDHVTASFVLNHISDPASALRKLVRFLIPGGTMSFTSWSNGPNENALGSVWSEIAENYVSRVELTHATRRALPSEEALRDLGSLSMVVRDTGLRILRSERIRFVVNMTVRDYIASRSAGVSARFMRAALDDERWRRFQARVFDEFVERFGDRAQFHTAVNFVVGMQA